MSDSPAPANKGPLAEVFKWLGAGTVPPVLSFLLQQCNLAPPVMSWHASLGLAVIVVLSLGILAGMVLNPAKQTYFLLQTSGVIFLALFVFAAIRYGFLYHYCVVKNIPGHKEPEVIGFELQPDAEIAEGVFRKKESRYPSPKELMKMFEYSAESTYTEESIHGNERSLFVWWMGSVILFSSFVIVAAGYHTRWQTYHKKPA